MELILHIGLHKTGSTAIQAALSGYDHQRIMYADLAPKGVLGNKNHSIPVIACFKEDFYSYKTFKDRGLSTEEIKKLQTIYRNNFENLKNLNKDKIIISGEEISNLSNDEANSLLEFFNKIFKKIIVIAYVRNPISFAASSFQQQLKGGIHELPDYFSPRYKHSLQRFKDHHYVSELVVRDYSLLSKKQIDIVTDFRDLCGIKTNNEKTAPKNSSLSNESIKILFRLNQLHDANHVQWDFKSRQAFIYLLGKIFPKKEDLPSELILPFADFSEVSWLKTEVGINFERSNSEFRREDLLNWCQDLDDLKEPLNEFASSNKIDKSDGLDQIIMNIYSLCMNGMRFKNGDFKLSN